MSDLAWKADGIEKARACGGLDLDVKRRAGFTGVVELRVVNSWPANAWATTGPQPYADHDPMPDWLPPTNARGMAR